MFSSLIPNNIDGSVYRGIKKVDFTSQLDINEPSLLSPTPIYRILNNTGDIINDSNEIIVSVHY